MARLRGCPLPGPMHGNSFEGPSSAAALRAGEADANARPFGTEANTEPSKPLDTASESQHALEPAITLVPGAQPVDSHGNKSVQKLFHECKRHPSFQLEAISIAQSAKCLVVFRAGMVELSVELATAASIGSQSRETLLTSKIMSHRSSADRAWDD